MVERTAFEAGDLVDVAQVELALHLVGVHGPFAEQAEDGQRPQGTGDGSASASGAVLPVFVTHEK